LALATPRTPQTLAEPPKGQPPRPRTSGVTGEASCWRKWDVIPMIFRALCDGLHGASLRPLRLRASVPELRSPRGEQAPLGASGRSQGTPNGCYGPRLLGAGRLKPAWLLVLEKQRQFGVVYGAIAVLVVHVEEAVHLARVRVRLQLGIWAHRGFPHAPKRGGTEMSCANHYDYAQRAMQCTRASLMGAAGISLVTPR
jgi:hypothetical protein